MFFSSFLFKISYYSPFRTVELPLPKRQSNPPRNGEPCKVAALHKQSFGVAEKATLPFPNLSATCLEKAFAYFSFAKEK